MGFFGKIISSIKDAVKDIEKTIKNAFKPDTSIEPEKEKKDKKKPDKDIEPEIDIYVIPPVSDIMDVLDIPVDTGYSDDMKYTLASDAEEADFLDRNLPLKETNQKDDYEQFLRKMREYHNR